MTPSELERACRAQLPHTLDGTELGLGERYQGKVRDTYRRGDTLVLVATDRLSAFDRVLTTLPFKGEILTQVAASWFEATRDIAPNHVIDVPDPSVMVAHVTTPVPLEFVVRGYLTGSLWRDVEAGRDPYGLKLPPGLRKDQAFDEPILTPSTKAPRGTHDEPISEVEVLARGILSRARLEEARELVFALFRRGQALAAERGLILVDTKYELGFHRDGLMVIDEMHTPDSSRFWERAEYAERFARGDSQKMLDKENLRAWLIERGFSGEGTPPAIPDDVRVSLAGTYITAYERITGRAFSPSVGDVMSRIQRNLRTAGLR